MRLLTLLVGVIGVVGAASADDTEFNNINQYDSSDYAATLFYKMQFGGHETSLPQSSLSFQVNNERASQFGAPAMLRTDFGSTGVTRFALNGVDLRSTMLVNQAAEGGLLSGLSTTQVIVYGVLATVGVVLAGQVVNNRDDDVPVSGTGGS